MKTKVLLIDDDQEMAELLSDYFRGHNIVLVAAETGEQGVAMLRQESPDCVLLDVMLPDDSGFSICKAIRKNSNVPLIMLTARGELADRITGLELGADDYLPKPFEPRELVARIQALLRRLTFISEGKVVHCGDLTLDIERRTALRGGVKLPLSTLEFDALLIFVNHVGRVLSRDKLSELLNSSNWESNRRSVDVIVSRIRSKLGDDPHDPRYLITVHKTGYLLVEPA
jgi:DNA-binding response OmpR family regulator